MGEASTVAMKLRYPDGTTEISETWEPIAIFCPECGEGRVWRECGEGDYELGPLHLCTACGARGYLLFSTPNPLYESDSYMDAQRLEAIKEVGGG